MRYLALVIKLAHKQWKLLVWPFRRFLGSFPRTLPSKKQCLTWFFWQQSLGCTFFSSSFNSCWKHAKTHSGFSPSALKLCFMVSIHFLPVGLSFLSSRSRCTIIVLQAARKKMVLLLLHRSWAKRITHLGNLKSVAKYSGLLSLQHF